MPRNKPIKPIPKNYEGMDYFLKALAQTIVTFLPSVDTFPPPPSPHQFLLELAREHHQTIEVSEHDSETLEFHKEAVRIIHDKLADFVDDLE